MLVPSSRMTPVWLELGMRSFIRLSARRKVDLPQPEGPISAVTWCSGMARLTFLMATLVP